MTEKTPQPPKIPMRDKKVFRRSQRPSTHRMRRRIDWLIIYPASAVFLCSWLYFVFHLIIGDEGSALSASMVSYISLMVVLTTIPIRAYIIPAGLVNSIVIFPTAASRIVLFLIPFAILYVILLLTDANNYFREALLALLMLVWSILPVPGILTAMLFPQHRRLVDLWNPRSLPYIPPPALRRKQSKKGMTLIELLFVIAIFAIMSTGILQVSSGYATSLKREKIHRNAILLGQNQIDYFRATGDLPEAGSHPLTPAVMKSAEIAFPGSEVIIIPTDQAGMVEVRVRVSMDHIQGTPVASGNIEFATLLVREDAE